MKIGNRIISIVALALCVNAHAGTISANGYTWTYDLTEAQAGVGVSIVSVSPLPSGFVSIPDTIEGKPVVTIGHMFSGCKDVTGVHIPSTVATIYTGAFSGCERLATIELPQELESLENSLFNGCRSLVSVVIPQKVSRIGNSVFGNCEKLETVVFPEGLDQIGDYVFEGQNRISSLNIPSTVTKLGGGVFSGCSCLERVVLPRCAFQDEYGNVRIGQVVDCAPWSLRSIVVREGVTEIGEDAFRGLNNLTSVSLPMSLRKIRDRAFEGCSSLGAITIPPCVTSIGQDAFAGCPIETLVIPGSVMEVRRWFSSSSTLRSVTFKNGVLNIAEYAFAYCGSLDNVSFASSITNVGDFAFCGCRLRSLRLPRELKRIGCRAFSMPVQINEIKLPDGLETIGDCAFSEMHGFGNLRIPDGVQTIGVYAFQENKDLTNVVVAASVREVGTQAFDHGSGLDLTFLGNAPAIMDGDLFGSNDGVTIHLQEGTTGWSPDGGAVDSWQGCPVVYATQGSDLPGKDNVASVSMTVTNVVVHYIKTAIQSDVVSPVGHDTGYVTIVAEVKGGAFSVPESWAENYPTFSEKYGGDFTAALAKPSGKTDGAGNPMFVWQDYVAGTDPTNPEDKFTASITIVDGVPQVSYSPEFSNPGEAAKRKYTILGKVKLTDKDWDIVDSNEANYNFFKVTVEMR